VILYAIRQSAFVGSQRLRAPALTPNGLTCKGFFDVRTGFDFACSGWINPARFASTAMGERKASPDSGVGGRGDSNAVDDRRPMPDPSAL
jgi:hypothetical protein